MIADMTRSDATPTTLLKYAGDGDRRTVANAFHERYGSEATARARVTAPLTVLHAMPHPALLSADEFDGAIRASFASASRAAVVRIDESRHTSTSTSRRGFLQEVARFMRIHR